MPHPAGLRILVVDDEPAVLDVLASCLEVAGHSVGICDGGLAALERFVSCEWDIVVTDRIMPGMSGSEFATAVKAISPATPVIMMTGLTEQGRLGSDYPVDLVLPKPFTLKTLQGAIETVSDKVVTSARAA